MTGNAIDVTGLRKHYGSHAAVDGLSLTVGTGEVFGLLGPNGAGKTTTVECILGLREPDAGSIRLLGHSLAGGGRSLRARLGVQLQSTGLFPRLTVRETMDLFATFFPRPLSSAQLIEMVGLREKERTLTADLSGGQRQRLALALALVGDPDVIFLDEPTTAMDPQARRQVWDIVRDLARRGKAVLLTTHYMEEAAQLCHRVAVVDRGRIIAEGNPQALVRQHFQEAAVEFATPAGLALDQLKELPGVARIVTEDGHTTLFTADVPDTVAALVALSRSAGFDLESFTVRNATLEDLFLRLTGRRMRS